MTAPDEESASSLPPAVNQEVLRRFADLLRVGRLNLNGHVVSWETDTSTECQLQGFCACVCSNLRELLPELAQKDPMALRLAPYWLLKSVAINYALIEVVLMIRQRVGVFCTIETREEGGGPLVEYGVDVLPGPALRVSLTWSRGDNIIYRDPRIGTKKVKGSFTKLSTEFQLPPNPGVIPAYTLQMQLRRSLASKVVSKLACGGGDAHNASNFISVEEPLRSDSELEVPTESCTHPENVEEEILVVPGTPLAVKAGTRGIVGNPFLQNFSPEGSDQLVGHLCVRKMRIRGLSKTSARSDVYATCTTGGSMERTRFVRRCTNLEWPEVWSFPLRERDLRGEVVLEVFTSTDEYAPLRGLMPQRRQEKLELLGSASVLVSLVIGSNGAVRVAEPFGGVALGDSNSGRCPIIKFELELLPASPSGVSIANRGPTVSAFEEESCAGTIDRRSAQADREDTPLRVQVRAAAPVPGTCGFWCNRSFGIECN